MKKVFTFLPFIVLSLIYLSRVFVFLKYPVFFGYDEIVINTIKKEPLPALLDAVKAEPHPPGIHLLLKYVPLRENYQVKLFTATAGYILFLAALLIAKRIGAIKSFFLNFGVSIFLATDAMIEIFSVTKQDIITFPILLTIFFLFLYLIKKRKFNLKVFITLHCLCLILLAFGYIAYFQGLFLIFCLTLLFRKEKYSYILLTIQFLIFASFFLLFGLEQLKILIGFSRITWIFETGSGFVSTLGNFLTGGASFNIWYDFSLLTFIIFAFVGVTNISKLSKEKVLYVIPALAFLLLIQGYFTHSFARQRYLTFLFLNLSILAGWGIVFLTKKKKAQAIATYFVLLFSFYNIIHHVSVEAAGIRGIQKFNSTIQKVADKNRTGLIFESSLFGFLYVNEYKLSDNLVPINVFHPELTRNSQLTKEFTEKEYDLPDLTGNDVKLRLQKTGLGNFIYLLDLSAEKVLFDPKRQVYSTLSSYCNQNVLYYPDPTKVLYLFHDCKF